MSESTPPRGATLQTITRRRSVEHPPTVIGYALDCRECGLETVYLLRSMGSLAQAAAASAVRRHNAEVDHPDPATLPGIS